MSATESGKAGRGRWQPKLGMGRRRGRVEAHTPPGNELPSLAKPNSADRGWRQMMCELVAPSVAGT
eukprot:3860565-Rhodomonas_salina.1